MDRETEQALWAYLQNLKQRAEEDAPRRTKENFDDERRKAK